MRIRKRKGPREPTDWPFFALVTVAVVFAGIVVGALVGPALTRVPWDTRLYYRK